MTMAFFSQPEIARLPPEWEAYAKWMLYILVGVILVASFIVAALVIYVGRSTSEEG